MIGSAQLMVLGIVGEYIGRLYMESKRRPIYLVDSIVRKQATETVSSPKPPLTHPS